MYSAHAFFQPTHTIRSFLREGKSVLLSAPMGSRIGALLGDTAMEIAKLPDTQVVNVALTYAPDGSLDTQNLWAQISRALKYRPKAVARTSGDLEILLHSYFLQRSEGARVLLTVTGVRSGPVQSLYEAVGGIHCQQEKLRRENKILQLLISDHFALRFHMKRNLPLEESELYLLEQIETPVFDAGEILDGLSLIRSQTEHDFEAGEVAERLFEATGGHYSLLMLAVEHLISVEFAVTAAFWRTELARVFESSDATKMLRQALDEDHEGIVETALKYTEPSFFENRQSPRIMKLRALGVLHDTADYRLKLCGGFIRKVIEAVSRQKPINNRALGTFQTFSGLASYDGSELKKSDADLVILHVSDLHVGNEHAFRLSKTARRAVGDRGALAEYIHRDLDKMGLAGAVDGLLVSGDITCRANPGEFARAAEVIQEIATVAGVPGSNIALVPGNHDIQWQPDEFAQRHGINRTVSRENFDQFYCHLIGHSPDFPEIRSFANRDGSGAIDLVCLDSNHVEGPDAAGIGMIDPETLSVVASKLSRSWAKEGSDLPRRTVWFMSHHHYLPVCDVDVTEAGKRKVSVMANASQVLSIARNLDVEVILHGHQHQPFLCHASRWMGSTDPVRFRPLLMVGAGSVGAGREQLGPIAQNHYFLLVRQDNRLVIRSRKFGDEGLGFVPHDDFVFARPHL